MSKFSSPIPVATKIVDNLETTIPWKKWFKDIGDDWVSSNKTITLQKKEIVNGKIVLTPTSFNYVVNGSICFFSFNGTSETIELPFSVGVDSVINGVVVSRGTKTITLDSPLSGFFFIQF